MNGELLMPEVVEPKCSCEAQKKIAGLMVAITICQKLNNVNEQLLDNRNQMIAVQDLQIKHLEQQVAALRLALDARDAKIEGLEKTIEEQNKPYGWIRW